MKRRTVVCWVCGHRARRVPHAELLTVVGLRRQVHSYGVCGAALDPFELDLPCDGVMLLPASARRVLRAALRCERNGGNLRSEYDL